ncbi:MAG TPA: tetratricopeptide repeat protein [Cyclobacteriaceae bacterium]|nr:tetratricopeptide repeat protein [Cyclobacteriaceae bacterium]
MLTDSPAHISTLSKIRGILSLGIFVFASMSAWCQNSIIDSLKIQLESVPENSITRADLFHELASSNWDINFDEGLRWAQQGQELSNKINYKKGIVQSLTDIGQYYYYTAEYPVARQFYKQALDAAGSENFGNYPAYTLTRLGNLYRVQSSFDSARYYYERSLELLKDREEARFALSSVYFNLAALHADLSEFDEAYINIKRSLDLNLKMQDSIGIAECWSYMGNIKSREYELDSAGFFLDKSFRIAEHYNNTLLRLLYFNRSGELAYRSGNYEEAIERYSSAIELMKKVNYRRYYPELLKGIGQIFRVQGDFNRALENYFSALEMSEALNNMQEVSRINNLIGWLYINEDNDSLAFEFGKRSLDQSERLDDKAGMAGGYNLLGYVHLQRKEFDDAVDLLSKSLQLREELKLDNEVCSTLFNLALVYRDNGLYPQSIDYHTKIFQYDSAKVDKRLQVMTYNSLGNIFLLQKRYDQAIRYLNDAGKLALNLKLPIQLKDNKRLFAELYTQQGDFRRAAQFYEDYVALNDSLFKQESLTKIAQLSAVYQLSRKEKEIRTLSQENEVKQGMIEVQESRLRLQRNILTFSIIVLILLSLFLYVVYIYYRAKKKAHEELSLLNREISEKTEEIQAQSEELMEANESLTNLNNDLIESREEIQAQSEELIEANEIISNINADLERKVSERTAQLEKAYIELDTFFYRSSHDFRRPLTTFLGLAEVAKITVKDKKAIELFDKVRDTALNLDKMLVKLQSISDMGSQQLYYDEVDLKKMVLNVVETFTPELEAKGIASQFQFETERKIRTFPVLVRIILENLIENSINFSIEQDPNISIKVFEEDHFMCLEIKDNGQGFAEEFSDKIFDMYFRANFMSKGNGLGLYIVRKAVDKLNGRLCFNSVQYKGSTFTVSIPIQPGDG